MPKNHACVDPAQLVLSRRMVAPVGLLALSRAGHPHRPSTRKIHPRHPSALIGAEPGRPARRSGDQRGEDRAAGGEATNRVRRTCPFDNWRAVSSTVEQTWPGSPSFRDIAARRNIRVAKHHLEHGADDDQYRADHYPLHFCHRDAPQRDAASLA